jgi:hypothetical protein
VCASFCCIQIWTGYAISKDIRTQDLPPSETDSIARTLLSYVSKTLTALQLSLPLPLPSCHLRLRMLVLASASIRITLNFGNRSRRRLSGRLSPFPPMSSCIPLKFVSRPTAMNCGRKKCRLALRRWASMKLLYRASTHRPLRLAKS